MVFLRLEKCRQKRMIPGELAQTICPPGVKRGSHRHLRKYAYWIGGERISQSRHDLLNIEEVFEG